MYMKEANKRSSKSNIAKLVLTTVGVISIALLYGSNHMVFANSNISEGKNTTLLALVYDTNPEVERSSRRPKLLTIKKGEFVYDVFTTEIDIYKILSEYKIPLDGGEKIIVSTNNIVNGSLIRVIKTETVIEEILSDIPFETKVIKTDKYIKGEEHTSQEGVLGIKKQKVLSYYEDGVLIDTKILAESIEREPTVRILEVGTAMYTLEGIDPKGYNCEYWHKVVDTGPYTEEEKRWLKFIMYCESGCNAESNKGSYKGLFQWSPYWWSKQFPENIFDGHAQIRHTMEKYRSGESTRASQWPACHARYTRTYGVN